MMKISRHRDLSLIDLNKDQILVVASDSAGGLGEKSGDSVKVDPFLPAYYTVLGPLMEILAFGAKPISLINNLCVEMEPTGRRIIEGMKYALKDLEMDDDNFITGSTEENFPVTTTGMGVTVLGIIDKSKWEKPFTKAGLLAIVVGIPKVGDEVKEDGDRTIMNLKRLSLLKSKPFIKEILPVGSKGIRYELGEMAGSNGLDYILGDSDLDLEKSAGPSTCVIVSMEDGYLEELRSSLDVPVGIIGRFVERG